MSVIIVILLYLVLSSVFSVRLFIKILLTIHTQRYFILKVTYFRNTQLSKCIQGTQPDF